MPKNGIISKNKAEEKESKEEGVGFPSPTIHPQIFPIDPDMFFTWWGAAPDPFFFYISVIPRELHGDEKSKKSEYAGCPE